MKRFLSLRLTLCLFLLGMVCNVAWAQQPKISPAPVDGQWAEGTAWYQIKTGNGFYFRSDRLANDGTLNLDQTTHADEAASLWCFVGTDETGYKIYNKEKGVNFSLGKVSNNAQLVENGTTTFDFSSTNVGENYRCLKEHDTANNYLNRNGSSGKLVFWNSTAATNNDNGSALMFYEVDLDAPTITSLIQLSNDKVYTLRSQRALLYYNDASWISSSKDVAYDRNDPKQQFRIEKHDGKYYFYSVGAGKYLNESGNYVDDIASAAAVTLHNVSGTYADYPWKPQLGSNYLNSQTSGGLLVNTHSTTDGGNSYRIEVGNIYTVHVLGDNVESATITIKGKQYQDGDVFAKTANEIQTSDVTASTIDGKVTIINVDNSDIYVSYINEDTQFYTLKGGHGGYVSLAPDYCDGDGNLKLTNSSTIKDRRGLWAFVGNETDGYQIYNYTTGLSKVLGMTGSEANARATMVAPDATTHTTTFDGTFKFDGTVSFIKLKGSANNYWNKRGDYLALWNDTRANDQGSSFYINAVDYTEFVDEIFPITPEAKEELDAALIKGATSFTPNNANTLWYTTSAQASGVSYPWMEYALPLGNGELGCMVFGGVLKEELQFNEKTLWSGPADVVGAAGGKRTFMNFGSLFIKNLDETLSEGVTDYVRYLDIEEGIAGVQFTNKNGTKQTRKYFSSAPDQVIAAQYKSEGTDKMHLLFKLEAESEIDAKYVTNSTNVTYADGMASFIGAMEAVNYAARVHVYADNGAVITTTDDGIEVSNATEVTFYLKGATNFNGEVTAVSNYFTADTPADVNDDVKTAIEAAHNKGFANVETAHKAEFSAITNRMTFDLGLTTPTVDTKTLVDNYYPNNTEGTSTSNDHLFLEQLYFHYGRYLAISSNRKAIAAPNNLQGIWNDRASDSPWNSDVHTNINIQMNYWPTEITNLSDLHKPFVNFIIRGAQSKGWKDVANNYNDGYGWSTLTETSLYNSMSTWGNNYLVANVWYTSHLWTHYRYTQDKEFLKQAFPVMWSAAEFWFHRLKQDEGYDSATQNSGYKGTPYKFEPDGTYVAPNEYSAEQNAHASEDGTAHAQQMISYLFQNISDAITILGRENVSLTDDQIATLNEYLEKTDKGLHTEVYTANSALNGGWTNPRNGVNQGDIILREWKYSPYDVSDDPGHRHLSHLMALFPMDQITPESEYFEPAVNSLKLRGDAATGWSMGWKVNLWARAQDGDHAHLIIKNALKHSTSYGTNAGAGGIYYNLFDSHAPFQIDGNFGVCSGMAEMLMQSAHGYINILPALPSVWEKTGTITGMKAMGNFTVDFNWKNGKAQKVTIVSHKGVPLKVRCNRGEKNIAEALITVNGVKVLADVKNGIATIPCNEGQTVVIDFTQSVEENFITEYEVDMKTGTFAGSGNYRSSWTYTTTDSNPAALTLSSDANNMNSHDGLIQLHSGTVASSTYTLTVPAGYTIVSYAFDYAFGNSGTNAKKFVIADKEYPVTAAKQSLKIEDINAATTTFVLSGENKPVKLSNFVVKVKSLLPEKKYTAKNEVNDNESWLGENLGFYSYTINDEKVYTTDVVKTAIDAAPSLQAVTNILESFELNMPQPGQYFRVAYDYGGSVGKLYMQGVVSTVKGVKFTEETGNASVWVYNDGTLTSYFDGRNLREVDNDRGLSNTKTTVTFSESTRAKGKYNITCTSYIHANSNGSDYFTDHCSSDGGHATHDLILEEAEVAVENVSIGEWEIGTFYANGAMEIPEGVSAYVATAVPVMEGETGVITLTKIQTGVVPAKTGVIITGKPGYYDFTSVTSDASVDENFMCGYAGPETMKMVTLTNDASYYILTVVNDTPGFYKKGYAFNVYNNKAYLKLPITVAASLRFRFNNYDGTTDIIEVPTEALNGNVEIYDLSGRRVEKAGKGVYIVNGKKVIF